MPPRAPSTIRYQMTCLVLAAVLPVWGVSSVLVFQTYAAKRTEVSRTILESARSLTMVVDR